MQFPCKFPRYLNSPNFSPNVAEIPNLGTNSPKVGSLLPSWHWQNRGLKPLRLKGKVLPFESCGKSPLEAKNRDSMRRQNGREQYIFTGQLTAETRLFLVLHSAYVFEAITETLKNIFVCDLSCG